MSDQLRPWPGDHGRGGDPLSETPRVLVADPQPTARASLRRVLERAGFEICGEADDADDVVEAARRERPALCVLDVLLPGGGIAAAAKIRFEAPQVAVVMFTASDDRDHLLESVQAGAAGYLLKDMDPQRLPGALRGVLNGEAAIPRALVTTLVDELRAYGRTRVVVTGKGRAELSRREWQVARLLADDLSTAEIGQSLHLSPSTVRRHISSIVRKLGVADREAAIALLRDRGS